VATADGRLADIARSQLERYLAERFRLGDDEQRRLRAHLAYIVSHPPTTNALRKRVSGLSEPERRRIGQLLAAVAAADGAMSQAEADALVRLYRMLDLDPSEMDSRAGATAPSDRLARLRTSGERTRDYALPNPRRLPKDSQRRVLDLDAGVIADRVAASARAASYLDALSTDQVEEDTPPGAVTHNAAYERTSSLDDDRRLHGLGTGTFRGSPGQSHDSVTGEGVKIWHRAQEQPQVQEQQAKKPAVMLDPKVVAARLAESDKVASYLAEVFTYEDTLTPMNAPPGLVQRQSEEGIAGLDQAHSGLLRRLAERDRWSRADFDSITAELGLMPDGALDTLNEVAVDSTGEPVCEGPDPIQMNKYAIEEMLQ
jgi:uncharacterized tellurite resistance protein B-like protein